MKMTLPITTFTLALVGAQGASFRAVKNRFESTLKEDNVCEQCFSDDFDSSDCLCSAFMWNGTFHSMKGCKSDDTWYDPQTVAHRDFGCICKKLPGPVVTCDTPTADGDQSPVEPVPMTPGVPANLVAVLKARGEYEPMYWEAWPPRHV